jgi:hypothetical protein
MRFCILYFLRFFEGKEGLGVKKTNFRMTKSVILLVLTI